MLLFQQALLTHIERFAMEPDFLLGATLRTVPNKKSAPNALKKCCNQAL